MATIKDNLTVEPVAYVTGYSKGRCIIEAVDPDWLLPVGMALYRSPPTISKTETVEPVAWMWLNTGTFRKRLPKTAVAENWTPLYTSPPKREPLTDEEITALLSQSAGVDLKLNGGDLLFARAIERMASEAGWGEGSDREDECVNCAKFDLERFAELVASDEREACEKICVEEFDAENPYIGQGKACAAAIRARGEE